MISGSTKIVGLIGHPVEHSFSPPMHNAAFGELGMDYAYIPFNVYPENLKSAIFIDEGIIVEKVVERHLSQLQ